MTRERAWFAFMTRSAAGFMDSRRRFPEFAAVEQMRERGIEAHALALRILRRAHRHARRREIAVAPLLPGYCFACMAAPPTRDLIKSLPHVLSVVRRGLEPAVLPAADVEALLALDGTTTPLSGPLPYDASGKVVSPDGLAQRVVKPGDRAIALSSGLVGTVEAVHRQGAIVLVELLGSLRRASVAISDLSQAAALR